MIPIFKPYMPSNLGEGIEDIIYSQGRSEGRRTWVLDKSAQVLASDGSLKRVFPDNVFNIVYTLLLPPAYDQFKDDLAGASRLQGNEVKQALAGNTKTRWRSSPDGKAVIVSAATPIWFDNKVVGAVVVEETTNNIQIMQRQVLAGLFNKTLLILFVIVFLLFVDFWRFVNCFLLMFYLNNLNNFNFIQWKINDIRCHMVKLWQMMSKFYNRKR